MTTETFMPGDAAGPAPTGLELVYGVLFRPTATFAALGSEAPLAAGAGAMLTVAAVLAFAMGPQAPHKVAITMLIALGWLFLTWLLMTGALFIVGRLMVGRGEIQGLLGGTALAFLPFILVGPMASFSGMGHWGKLFGACLFVGAVLWWLRLLAAAARGNMGLTSGQGVMAIVGMELLLAAIPMTYTTLWFLSLLMVIG